MNMVDYYVLGVGDADLALAIVVFVDSSLSCILLFVQNT